MTTNHTEYKNVREDQGSEAYQRPLIRGAVAYSDQEKSKFNFKNIINNLENESDKSDNESDDTNNAKDIHVNNESYPTLAKTLYSTQQFNNGLRGKVRRNAVDLTPRPYLPLKVPTMTLYEKIWFNQIDPIQKDHHTVESRGKTPILLHSKLLLPRTKLSLYTKDYK